MTDKDKELTGSMPEKKIGEEVKTAGKKTVEKKTSEEKTVEKKTSEEKAQEEKPSEEEAQEKDSAADQSAEKQIDSTAAAEGITPPKKKKKKKKTVKKSAENPEGTEEKKTDVTEEKKPAEETAATEEEKSAEETVVDGDEKPAEETGAKEFSEESEEKAEEETKAAEGEKAAEETKAAEGEKAAEETKAAEGKKAEEETKAAEGEKAAEEAKAAEGEKVSGEKMEAVANTVTTTSGSNIYQPKKKHKIGKIIGRIVLGTAATAALAGVCYYGYGAFYYARHYYKGTTAVIRSAGSSQTCCTEDLSGMTEKEAYDLLSSFTDDYVLTITSEKGTEDTISSGEIDYQVTPESLASLQTVIQNQDYFLWIVHMTDIAEATVNETIDLETAYDESKLSALLDSLKCITPDVPDAGKDAYLNYNAEEYRYEIVDAVSGNQGDKDKIAAKIEDALNTNADSLELEDSDYIQPAILSDNAQLVAKRDEINHYLDSKITISDNGQTIVVDGSVIINFLNIDENWNVVLDQTKITDYVNKNFDAAFDTRGTTRTVNLLNSGEVTMSVGTFGDFVQTTAEVEKLVAEISAGQTIEREPCYYNNYEVEGNGGIGDTYIDVNITQQKVYVVVDNKNVLTTDCVTGLTNGTRDTPIGFYYIWWMTTNYTMTTYNSFVYYWMPIDETGVGLHDATWRSSFGGTIYQSDGSHGCINLPLDMAKQIYSIAYVGMPVVVHK